MTPFVPSACVCNNLKAAARASGRAYDAALAPHGINVTQYAILSNADRYGPVPQMRLAEHLEMERTTLYRALAILEKRELLKLTSTSPGPTKSVSLTPAGKALLEAARADWEPLQERFVQAFGADGLQQLSELMARIRDHFHEGA